MQSTQQSEAKRDRAKNRNRERKNNLQTIITSVSQIESQNGNSIGAFNLHRLDKELR